MPEKKYSVNEFYHNLLKWYESFGRELPWRNKSPLFSKPYHVWISEIMLQQTTVETVKNRYPRFLQRWPTITDLANAELDQVLHEWQGLGYYARARNLHTCAKTIVKTLEGNFPKNDKELQRLPGIGSYTAAAIAAIAFDQPIVPIDSNIARVITRIDAIKGSSSFIKKNIQKKADVLAPNKRSGDFAEALMDLGSLICKPAKPLCHLCPLKENCKAYTSGNPAQFGKKNMKEPKPKRWGLAFWIRRRDGKILFQKRPNDGLLGGMTDLPGSSWNTDNNALQELKRNPKITNWSIIPGEIHHTFSHFHLNIRVAVINPPPEPLLEKCFWHCPASAHELALPALTKKIISHVIQFEKLTQ